MNRLPTHRVRPASLLAAVRHPLGGVAVAVCALALLVAVAWRDGDASAAPPLPGSDVAVAPDLSVPHPSSARAPSAEVAQAVPFL